MPGTVEMHASLDVHDLHRTRAFGDRTAVFANASLRWPWIKRLSVNRWRLQIEFPSGGLQSVAVVWSWCHFGGGRPWFTCPHCQRRVGKLYCCNRGSYSACRICYQLRYASQRRGAKSQRWLTALKLRMRLGGLASIAAPFPERPCGMHRRTYDRLRLRAERLERGLNRFQRRRPDYSILIPK
jgi:hypothetical protein